MNIEFKCPQCGANMEFDPDSGFLMCSACNRKERIEDVPEVETEEIQEVAQAFVGRDLPDEAQYKRETKEEDKLVATEYENEQQFICKSCGAAIIVDEDDMVTTCPYCGSNIALGERMKGEKRPVLAIPFKLSKEKATANFMSWAKKGKYCPKEFIDTLKAKEIHGIYVPFFLYDMDVTGDIEFKASKSSSRRSGDYIYTTTKYYQVYRRLQLNYDKVPADASVKMDDRTMDELEPFDYNNLCEFKPAYLAGFAAEKYNLDEKELEPRVNQRVLNYATQYAKDTVTGYGQVQLVNNALAGSPAQTFYTMLPVWVMSYHSSLGTHSFVMNGETGKIVGKLPISKGKCAKWFFIYQGICMAILFLITVLTYWF